MHTAVIGGAGSRGGFKQVVGKVGRTLAALGLLGSLALPLAGPAQVAQASNGPITITGDFTLGSDLTFSDSGFIISADNITLDLGGHTITGPALACNPCPPADGVLLQGHTGVTVKNGTIRGFLFGVKLDSADGNTIQDITALDNALNGISLFNDSDNNLVEGCAASNNSHGGSGFGVIMNTGSDGNTVRNCTVTNNLATGLFIGGGGTPPVNTPSFNNTVESNLVTGNLNHGIQVHNAHSNTVKNNTLSSNNASGVLLSGGATGTMVEGNLVDGHGNNGIQVSGAHTNAVKDNAVSNNSGRGINLSGGATGNEVRDNQITNNLRDGIFVSATAPAPFDNLFAENTLSGNGTQPPVSQPVDRDIRDLTTGAGTLGTSNTYQDNTCVTSTPTGLCLAADTVAPTTTAAAAPLPNGAGWNNSDVTIALSAVDDTGGSGVQDISVTLSGAQTGASVTAGSAASVTVSVEGTTTVSYAARDNAGNQEAAQSLTVKIDKTGPTVTYSGNAGTYTVDQTVNITCAATDAVSGVASHTCQDVSGPAYTLGMGTHTLSATAEDYAGNTGSGSASFTVQVTYDSLCNLARQFSAKKSVGYALCVELAQAEEALADGKLKAKEKALDAFVKQVRKQKGEALSVQEAEVLTALAGAL